MHTLQLCQQSWPLPMSDFVVVTISGYFPAPKENSPTHSKSLVDSSTSFNQIFILGIDIQDYQKLSPLIRVHISEGRGGLTVDADSMNSCM